MIPAAFEYFAPATVDEALGLLREHSDAKVLAGGQSLMPALRLRLAAPEVIVDIQKIDDLRGVRDDGDALVIGAMTPHSTVESDPLVAEHARLIALATATVGDPQIRHRGTFGGSLAHADPAADLPAVAVALDASFVIAGAGGRRTVPAAEFFEGVFSTALGEDELLVEVRVPKYTGWGAHYEKFNRVAQGWSIVSVAAAVRLDGDSIAEARVGLGNMGPTPVRATAVEAALVGQPATADAVREAAARAADGTSPVTDINGDADYRRHLATVLTRRAVLAAAGTA
ncbi:FAD binding domain-containing protein [Kribbella speibonae]|uniref:Xanthine dehydrogenase family protein subunit M n=1 Tax=Kribbella speibonae TaxID=1572660 RepID=A0A4V2M526_9ACTN|nr:xanthine dehydrogenase family protein subunit M [Kribbella speibonae]TCC23752.1 xanthine dehydrogenase family protein subunit M [Kribbella speibonae]TCC38202.1 xanthine dehydrogenase family protein subunit M [Kribbella speibonae]